MKVTFYCKTCKETEIYKPIIISPFFKDSDALIELIVIGFNFAQKHERHKIKTITGTSSCWEQIID